MMVDTILVSLVGTGAISWLYYANRLQQLPLGVVGAAIGVALLPILSKQLKAEEVEEAKQTQDKAIEYGAILSMPAAVALMVLAEPIVNVLFQHGKFGVFETEMTAKAVVVYAISLPVYVMVKALTPNFFARCDTKTPVKYSAVVLIANLVFALLLMKPFGHVGIASAATLSAFVSLYQYIRGLKKRGFWSFSNELKKRIAKIFLCSLIMGAFLYIETCGLSLFMGEWLEFSLIVKFILLAIIGMLALLLFLIMIKITGVMDAFVWLKSFLNKRRKLC
jgi:putative peptidoglycan lipid II flippase